MRLARIHFCSRRSILDCTQPGLCLPVQGMGSLDSEGSLCLQEMFASMLMLVGPFITYGKIFEGRNFGQSRALQLVPLDVSQGQEPRRHCSHLACTRGKCCALSAIRASEKMIPLKRTLCVCVCLTPSLKLRPWAVWAVSLQWDSASFRN